MHGLKCSKNNLISLSKALPVTGYSFLGHLMRLCSLLSKVWLHEKRLSIDQFRAKYFRIIFSIWYPFGFLIVSIELLFFKGKGF